MPLFGLSIPQPAYGSPSTPKSFSMSLGEASSEMPSQPSSTVRLSCLSPNGRSVHSFSIRQSMAYIETQALPLEGTVEGLESDRDDQTPSVIRTTLPTRIASALRQYPAVELLCVDVETPPSATKPGQIIQKLPKLCLYSRKDVFLLELGYTIVPGSSQVDGTVCSITEPFDPILLGTSGNIDIIRIRQAPQQYKGYSLMCPPEAMAMLVRDNITNEYSLHLNHGADLPISTPLVYSMEELDNPLEQVKDFCFLQSNSFSLLSGLSIAVLKASGDVLQASPILFQGTVVSQSAVDKTLSFLDSQLQNHDPTTPKGRQCRVAKQYIIDCFPKAQARGHFVLSKDRSAAFEWPAQLQGPILVAPDSDDFPTEATSIEPLDSSAAMDMVAVAIGFEGYKVDFGLLAPTMLIPRFSLEHADDTQQLDQDLKWGAIVNRVDLRDDEVDAESTSCALIRDPIMETVIHYVTPTCIRSISTNAIQLTANQLRDETDSSSSGFLSPQKRKDLSPRTTGWSCLDVSQAVAEGAPVAKVVGAVVSGDVQFGHVMIVRLSNETMFAVNLTETRQLQEIDGLGDNNQLLRIEAQSNPSTSKELEMLRNTVPLVEIVQEPINKVVAGLRGMGKIVGSATPKEKITPDLLAAALEVKEQCDKEVMMPLMEVNEHVNARMKEIVVMYNNQVGQLKTLRESVAKLKKGEASIKEKLEVANANSTSLAKRSASVLQSANDLLPTITQAEYDYFQELKRLLEKIGEWNEVVDRLKHKASTLSDSIEQGTNTGAVNIPEESIVPLNHMLTASGKMMKQYDTRLEEVEANLEDLCSVAGIDRDPHGVVGRRQ